MSFKLLALTASIIAYIAVTLKNSDLNCNYIEYLFKALVKWNDLAFIWTPLSVYRLAPSPEFTGNLAPNTKLQKATYLAKGKIMIIVLNFSLFFILKHSNLKVK